MGYRKTETCVFFSHFLRVKLCENVTFYSFRDIIGNESYQADKIW